MNTTISTIVGCKSRDIGKGSLPHATAWGWYFQWLPAGLVVVMGEEELVMVVAHLFLFGFFF